MSGRGPLGRLAGVPGVPGALARAAVAALVQTAGLVLLAGGLATAVTRAAGLAAGPVRDPLVLAVAGVVLRAVAGTVGTLLADRDARRAEDELRAALLDRLVAGPAAVDAAGGAAPAAVLATTRLAGLTPALAGYLPALAATLVVPLALVVVLARVDLLSAALVAGTLPLVPVFMALVGLHTRDASTAAARALDRIAAHVAELVRGLPVLVGLGRAAEQATALTELGEEHRRRTGATLRLAFLSSLVLELLATLSVALVAVTVGLRLTHGSIGLAAGLTALLLAPEAFAPLRALGAAHHAGDDAALAAAEARAVLVADVVAPAPGPGGAAVVVRGLTVAFPGRGRPALPPVDLTVLPGELVALRGPSGSGKSTLLAALAGVLPATASVAGSVSGTEGVAYVPQHPRTTAPTVADELRRHGADDVAAVLARVGAGALAGRRCSTLSPGELARVALARALVRVRRGASVLLLDEPTAHLDEAAAATVAAVLADPRGRVPTLVVTHDPALAALADRTVVLGGALGTGSTAVPRAFGTESPTVSRAPGTESTAAPGGTGSAGGGLREPRGVLAAAVAAGALSAGAGVALTAVSGWLIVRAAQLPPILTLMVAIVGVRAFSLVRAGMRWVERVTAHDAALRLSSGARVRVWQALAAQGLAADRTPGAALARVVGDVGLLQDLSVRVRPPLLVAAVTALGTVAALVALSPAAGLAVGAVLALATAAVVLAVRRGDAGAARHEAAARVASLRDTTAVLDGAADLRAHGLAARVAGELADAARGAGTAGRRVARTGALGSGALGLAAGLASVTAAAVGAAQGDGGPLLAVLALAPLALADPLAGIVPALQRRGALADARARITAVLSAPVAPDPADPHPVPAPVRQVAVDALTAGWPGGPDVLRGLTARAAAGEGWLVVRGPSGSGKSTLLAVLMAALRPRDGRYGVAGVDTAGLRGDDLRARIAWLPQEAHVFSSTVRANLALAAPRGALTGPDGDARMRAALTAAGLGGLLATLPDGLDTPVGAGGTALSGGERRRLAAARALLAGRDVVLLDEPTAHLDPPTAQALLADLRAALTGQVVVCVTHDDTVEQPGDTVLDLGRPALLPQGA